MPRIRLTVAYVGTRYRGWQVQGQGATIQGAIEDKLACICGESVRLHGSGRTDSGVHALAQVAHFDAPESKRHIPWQQALNSMLPDDIAIREAREVHDDFHARFSVRSKRYAYTLWTEPGFILPQRAPFVWPVQRLDFRAMDQTAGLLAGTHDFAAFQNAGTKIKNTVRTLEPIMCSPGTHPAEWVFRFQADGFLKQMVRNLMGLLVEVGRGRLDHGDVCSILEGCDRRKAPSTAPARGLTLEEVIY